MLNKDYTTNNDGNFISGKNEPDKSTCLGDRMYDIFENDEDIITENSTVQVKNIK